MAGYERQIAGAKRTIAKRGQAVEWLVRDEGVTDPAEVPGASKWRPKKNPDVDPVIHPVNIAFFPLDRAQEQSLQARGISDTFGMSYGLMGQTPFSPNQKDAVRRDGVIYPIESIDVLAPNGSGVTDAILYTIIFKSPVVIGG